MSESIFRKKSLDRVSSPETLDDYVKVPSPSGWMAAAAAALLLAAGAVWYFFL